MFFPPHMAQPRQPLYLQWTAVEGTAELMECTLPTAAAAAESARQPPQWPRLQKLRGVLTTLALAPLAILLAELLAWMFSTLLAPMLFLLVRYRRWRDLPSAAGRRKRRAWFNPEPPSSRDLGPKDPWGARPLSFNNPDPTPQPLPPLPPSGRPRMAAGRHHRRR